MAKNIFRSFGIDMSKISSSARIPLAQFRSGGGSFDKRLKYAKELNVEFLKQIYPEIKNGMVSPIVYRKILKNILPENIKVHIKKLPQSMQERGIHGCTSALGNTINGFALSLPIIKRIEDGNCKTMVLVGNMSTIMHENFHLFAELTNPKFLARCDFDDERGYDVFAKNLYGATRGFFGVGKMFNIMKYLKSKSLEDRINFLQIARYHLYEEHHAYIEGGKYNTDIFSIVPYNFSMQISFLEKLLYINLQKLRKMNSLDLAKIENN